MKTKVNTKTNVSTKPKSKALKQGAVSRSTNEKKIAKLLLEAMEILDKGSMFGIDWEETGKYYTKAYNAMEKLGYCG